jgi:hypothetical protein
VKPGRSLFARLRAKRDERDLEKARREGFEAGRRHAEIIGRVEWTKAALATAEKTGDLALIQKASENAVAATAAMNEMHRDEIAENARLFDFVTELQEDK